MIGQSERKRKNGAAVEFTLAHYVGVGNNRNRLAHGPDADIMDKGPTATSSGRAPRSLAAAWRHLSENETWAEVATRPAAVIIVCGKGFGP